MILGNGTVSANTPPQWISFVEGSSSVAPEESAFPTHVLAADTNLNNVDGGDASDGFSKWVTDILVYPTSEYWETLLSNNRTRPFIDFSISEYNTLRIPTAVHNYDLFVDKGKFYEDAEVDGTLAVGQDVNITGDATASTVTAGTVTANTLQGFSNTKVLIESKTEDFTFDASNTGTIYQCSPAGAKIEITLPTGLDATHTGTAFTVNNLLSGKTVQFQNLSNARGTILGERYSSCTIYWDGSAWYGIGDLV